MSNPLVLKICPLMANHQKYIMRIIFWNIRAGGGRRADGIFSQLLTWRPDIIGLSEFRGTPSSQKLAADLHQDGYAHQLSTINPQSKAKNALLLASRWPLRPLQLKNTPQNRERWLLASIQAPRPFTLGLMHVPNYTHPELKYPYLDAVLKMIDQWDSGPAILGGDTNCGKRGIDEEKATSPPIFKREHAWLEEMEKRQWVDGFRHLHGNRREFTWYSHRNNGFRLDYAFLNPEFRSALKGARHEWGDDPQQPERREALSDHAALIIDLDPQTGKT